MELFKVCFTRSASEDACVIVEAENERQARRKAETMDLIWVPGDGLDLYVDCYDVVPAEPGEEIGDVHAPPRAMVDGDIGGLGGDRATRDCEGCGKEQHSGYMVQLPGGEWLCRECASTINDGINLTVFGLHALLQTEIATGNGAKQVLFREGDECSAIAGVAIPSEMDGDSVVLVP